MKSQDLMMSSYSDLKFVQLEWIFHISNEMITIKVEKGSYCWFKLRMIVLLQKQSHDLTWLIILRIPKKIIDADCRPFHSPV